MKVNFKHYFPYKWLPQNKLHWSFQEDLHTKNKYVVVEFWTNGRCFQFFEKPVWNMGNRGLERLIIRLRNKVKNEVINQFGPHYISNRKIKI